MYKNGGQIMALKTIGFIGTGVMGKSMAANLMKNGFDLLVFNRTKAKAMDLLDCGAKWCDKISEIASAAQVVITMVGYPEDVEAIYYGEDGILDNASPGTILIDMTTSTPSLAKKIASTAKMKNLASLDAPVSGGDVGAKDATLSIMVGGDLDTFNKVLPVLESLGKNITLQGEAGSGQYTKMVNQIVIAGTMVGVCEAMAYAKYSGLNQEKVLSAIETGAAGSFSLSKLAPRMIKGNFDPGFYIKHFIKDMKIAIQSAEALGLNLPGLSLAKELYEKMAKAGEENLGTQALYKLYIS